MVGDLDLIFNISGELFCVYFGDIPNILTLLFQDEVLTFKGDDPFIRILALTFSKDLILGLISLDLLRCGESFSCFDVAAYFDGVWLVSVLLLSFLSLELDLGFRGNFL